MSTHFCAPECRISNLIGSEFEVLNWFSEVCDLTASKACKFSPFHEPFNSAYSYPDMLSACERRGWEAEVLGGEIGEGLCAESSQLL